MALALGSFWALAPAALASAVLVLRTSLEDRLLQADLAGYKTIPAWCGGGRSRASGETRYSHSIVPGGFDVTS